MLGSLGAPLACVSLGPCMYTRVRGQCSQTPPRSPSSQSPSVAAHVPGDSGGAWTPALRGWREHQSGQDLKMARERERWLKGGFS